MVSKNVTMTGSDMSASANETPIIRFVDLVIKQAISQGASDIHFEPFEDEFRVRCRIDGVLREMTPPSPGLALPILSRIKVMARLNIAERRVPQDGRISLKVAGRLVDLRVSTLPTQFGESLVLRVLDKEALKLHLDQLNMPPDVLANMHEISRRPSGIFLVTGPTGSGKTTTLYCALREVNKPNIKILTAEDPIEYEIDGVMQVEINQQAGLSFGHALRAFLRQDPDKIMVGEIRDLETAGIAVQAALTGHLVLSTLHTNDAPGAVTRLIDMGLESFLVAASLESVLAQRLVRLICPHCRVEAAPPPEWINLLELKPRQLSSASFFTGRGCEQCGKSGYCGRMGLFEMLMVNNSLRELIAGKASSLALRRKACEAGMRTLREDGVRAIFAGATTVEEVLKYT